VTGQPDHMNIREIRANAALLFDLTGRTYSRPVGTAVDLQQYALSVEFNCPDLKDVDITYLRDLRRRWEPEVQKERKLKAEKEHARMAAGLIWEWNRGENLSNSGAAARRLQGEKTRERVMRRWSSLSAVPKRDRAQLISESLGLSVRHVRRICGRKN
jgi:hypothetical protein